MFFGLFEIIKFYNFTNTYFCTLRQIHKKTKSRKVDNKLLL